MRSAGFLFLLYFCSTFRRCVVSLHFLLTFRRWAEAPPPREHIVALFADTSCRFHLPKVSSFPRFPHTFRRWAEAPPPREPIVATLADTSCRFHLPKVSMFSAFSSHLPKVSKCSTASTAHIPYLQSSIPRHRESTASPTPY